LGITWEVLEDAMNIPISCQDGEYRETVAVADGHVDLLYHLMRFFPDAAFSSLASGPLTPGTLQEGRVRLLVSALYCADAFNGPETASDHLEALWEHHGRGIDGVAPVHGARELETAYRGQGAPGMILLLENADALVDDGCVRWRDRGVMTVGLTHAGENRIGSGNGVKNPGPLTRAGLEVVTELSRLGMVIDVAHLSDPCFAHLVDVFSGPLISSHTGLRRFCPLPRNLSDEQVAVLMRRKGMIGITVNPEMLAVDQRAGLLQVFEQIDWLVQRYGDRQVALGSDFGGFDVPARGIEHPGKFQALSALMIRHGYPISAVDNIMGGNWYRFYGEKMR
jgi:membrane dipeptidase